MRVASQMKGELGPEDWFLNARLVLTTYAYHEGESERARQREGERVRCTRPPAYQKLWLPMYAAESYCHKRRAVPCAFCIL